MLMSKKWEIEGLNSQKSLSESAKIIMNHKINQLLSLVKKFFKNETTENLHNVRIALRRVRYNMELFVSCFDKKIFLLFYKQVELLQDISGKVRDIDVLTQNLISVKEKNTRVPQKIIKKMGEERENLNEALKLGLMRFIHSKELNNFQKLLS